MKSCPDYQEILLLDIHKELDRKTRLKWEDHLKSCQLCLKERTDLQEMIGNIRNSAPSDRLLPEESQHLLSSIRQNIDKELSIPKWRQWIQSAFENRVHALTAACLIVLVFGWFGTRIMENPLTVQTASNLTPVLNSEEKLLMQDYKVINNLDLLEEMEALEKLVQVVDKQEYGSCLIDKRFFVQKEISPNEYKI